MSKKAAVARANKSRSQLTKAEKAAIKMEQASFLQKIQTAEPNEHQEAIFAAARSGQGRYVILAGPGSGKTFTSIKASTSFTGRSIYFSYNKKIQVDTNEKLVAIDSPMVATTAHAFGLSCLIAYHRGQCKVDEEKYRNIVKQYILNNWVMYLQSIQAELEEDEEANVEVMRLDAQSWSESLVHYAQVSLTEPTPEGLARLVEEFDLSDITCSSPVWSFVTQVVAYALEEGVRRFLGAERLVSFDDMIYLPNVVSGVPVRQYDHVIVDECQDTSRAALELMLKACHAQTQFFAVGDPKQNIYRFAGAAEDSIGQIIERLHAETLPLRICYRCGSQIVDLANQLCTEQEKLISANTHPGNIQVVGASDYLEMLRPGAAVIGRTTKVLVQGCLKALQMGLKAKVLGRNIGDNIAAVVTRLEALRARRGVPALQSDLSNFLSLLDEYKLAETQKLKESRQHPEMAIAELEDKIETCRAFFEAYLSKCHDPDLRVEDDPRCAFNKTSKDFKLYIRGFFSDEEGTRDFILFLTAHRSKGGEWEDVFVVGTEEFPHPKAKSIRQRQQETNLMYVAITRAIHNLFFVGKPFSCLRVPGYEEEQLVQDREMEEAGFEDYDPDVVAALIPSSVGQVQETELHQLHHDEIEGELVTVVKEEGAEPLVEGRVRIAAVEVLCPACNGACADPVTGSLSIPYDLVGHTVVCSVCRKACIVPLNAFSLIGDVVAREKPVGQAAKREKKGRTPKERKSKAGRKVKGKGVRQPMQLSLDIRVINTLNAMGVNKSELFEELLQQYEPFLAVWTELGDDTEEEDGAIDE